jgi:DNA uptake protein ComE-like DNA-binding protein
MVGDSSGTVSVRRASWTRRVTVVGLAALLSGGCLETSAEDGETGNPDIAVDVAEEVADISPDETTSEVPAATETGPIGSGSSGTEPSETVVSSTPDDASPDTPVSGDDAEEEDPAIGTTTPVVGPTTTVTTTPTIPSTTTTTTGAVATGTASGLDVLTVAVETARSGYDRDLFPHWSDTNDSGCDARQDTLAAQVIGLPQVDLFDRCVIVEGDWYSIYDGVTHAGAPSELDVDHVVSLAEAWDSGASTWSRDRRRAFANDPRNLIAVTASSNRSKGDRDLGEWRPAQRSAWCVTATMTVETKAAYGLSVDPAERDAISTMLASCGGADQVTIGRAPAVAPPPAVATTAAPTTAAPAPAPPPAEEAAPGCVDINAAGVSELERIIHIGPARATEMLSLRPFTSVADMDRITGIGTGRLADIVAEGLACVP